MSCFYIILKAWNTFVKKMHMINKILCILYSYLKHFKEQFKFCKVCERTIYIYYHLFVLLLLTDDSTCVSIALTSRWSSFTTVARACGFTPFSHSLMQMLKVIGSRFVFSSLEIWYRVWNVLRAAFTWWFTGSGMLARFRSFLEEK